MDVTSEGIWQELRRWAFQSKALVSGKLWVFVLELEKNQVEAFLGKWEIEIPGNLKFKK